MKITETDMDNVREVIKKSWSPRGFHTFDEIRDTALALILVRIYDRGYIQATHDIQADKD